MVKKIIKKKNMDNVVQYYKYQNKIYLKKIYFYVNIYK